MSDGPRLLRAVSKLGKTRAARCATASACVALAGCVSFPDAPERLTAPRFDAGAIVSVDGAQLAVAAHKAADERAVVLALHGMNDYGAFFEETAAEWARTASITTYALDQRGFGRSPDRGVWPGAAVMRADVRAALEAISARHPDQPLFLLGHSMGAAVALSAMADRPLDVDGVILAAPAVWGGAKLPIAYRLAVNVAARFAPGKTLTGERAARQASDNIDVLRAMAADPLIIKETRLDAVLGVMRLMGDAWDATDEVGGRLPRADRREG